MSAAPSSTMASKRQVLLHKDEEGWWIAEVPSLPGCASQGKTRDEALRNVKEAIECHTEAMRAAGEDVPDDSLDALLVTV